MSAGFGATAPLGLCLAPLITGREMSRPKNSTQRWHVELKQRWFKQKVGGSMPSRKRSANKTRKMILTAVIGSLAALGIGGAGYVTWSALSATSAAESVATQSAGHHVASRQGQHAEKTSKTAHHKLASARKVKAGTSCKITKSKKHKASRHKIAKQKTSKHKLAKHKRDKSRHAH